MADKPFHPFIQLMSFTWPRHALPPCPVRSLHVLCMQMMLYLLPHWLFGKDLTGMFDKVYRQDVEIPWG